jgi:outer membrane cobalamin receptor
MASFCNLALAADQPSRAVTGAVSQDLPRSEAYATTDIIAIIPVRSKMTVQGGINNLFGRNFFYTAGYPEPGRNWFVNLRYRFSSR